VARVPGSRPRDRRRYRGGARHVHDDATCRHAGEAVDATVPLPLTRTRTHRK
jgi:hypothetical protein